MHTFKASLLINFLLNSFFMWNINEIQNIWQLVSECHDGQKYGGAKPDQQIEYINHIGSVVFEILHAAKEDPELNADLAIKCALLHDTLEDTSLTYNSIAEKYGAAVAEGVLALTKDNTLEDKQEKIADSLRRIKQQPKAVWAVKLADRICNLYAPPFYWTSDKKKEYMDEARFILRELAGGNSFLEKRLLEKINRYEKFLDA